MPEATFNIDPGATSRGTGDSEITMAASTGIPVSGSSNNTLLDAVTMSNLSSKAGNTSTDGFMKFTTTIPTGSTINSATLNFEAASSSAFTNMKMKIRGLDPSGFWSASSITDHADNAQGMVCSANDTSAVLIAEGCPTTSAGIFAMQPNGGSTNHCQVMRNTAVGTLGSVSVRQLRRGNVGLAGEPVPSAESWVEIWSVTGSAGAYQPSVKLAESDHRGWATLSTSLSDEVYLFTGVNRIAMPGVSGAYRLMKLAQNFTPQEADGGLNKFFQITAWGPASGSFNPSTWNGVRLGTFSAFSKQLYPIAQHIDAIPELGTETFFSPPSITVTTNYTWGTTSSGSPDYTTTHIENAITNTLADPDYNGAVGLRLETEAVTTAVVDSRAMAAYNHATATAPSLTVNWTAPGLPVSVASDIVINVASDADFFAKVAAATDVVLSATTAAEFLLSVSLDSTIVVNATVASELLAKIAAASSVVVSATTDADFILGVAIGSSIDLNATTAADFLAQVAATSDVVIDATTAAQFLRKVAVDSSVDITIATVAQYLKLVAVDASIDLSATTAVEFLAYVAAGPSVELNATTAADFLRKVAADANIVLSAATAGTLFEACILSFSVMQAGDDSVTATQPGDDTITSTQPGDDTFTLVQPGDDTITAIKPGDDTITASTGCE